LLATEARKARNYSELPASKTAMSNIRVENFPLKTETDLIIGIGIEIHKLLGFGFLEIVYKDAYEYEFIRRSVHYAREKEYKVLYKDIILAHKFFADFVVFNKVILELKAKEGISEEDQARMINYLKCSGCKVGLILNFGRVKLEIKRVVF
jgi:GxxExxY protein